MPADIVQIGSIFTRHTSGSVQSLLGQVARPPHYRGMALLPFLPPHIRIVAPSNMAGIFAPLATERVEVAAFAYLAADGRLLGMRQTRSRSPDLVDLPLRVIATDALSLGTATIIMAHNHPSESPLPSQGDINATRSLVVLLRPMDIVLHDHLIVTTGGITSFRASGLL